MRRWLLGWLLISASAAHAVVPRVTVEVKLAPATMPIALPNANWNAASGFLATGIQPSAATSVRGLSTVSRPAVEPQQSFRATQVSPSALLLPLKRPITAPAALTQPLLPSAITPAFNPSNDLRVAHDGIEQEQSGRRSTRALDALKIHAAETERLAASLKTANLEDAAPALGRNFAAAAGLDPEVPATPFMSPGGEGYAAAQGDQSELLGRLLERLNLDHSADPRGKEALIKALERMLRSPTARALSERFIASGAGAYVLFEEVPGSRVFERDGRRIFQATRGFTEIHEGGASIIRLNKDYLDSDERFRAEDLPATLAHELLGHALWNHQAIISDSYQAFFHHEVNEANARVVGWLVDFELDGRLEEGAAWNFLADPNGWLAYLKLRLPYYAMTFTTEELADPIKALEDRLAQSEVRRAQLEKELSNHRSWTPVINHFVASHGVTESRFAALRQHLANNAANAEYDLEINAAVIKEIRETVERMRAEPERTSEKYLQRAATNPMFAEVQKDLYRNTARLADLVRRYPPPPDAEVAQLANEHWDGQIGFDELLAMVREDQRKHPDHWR